MSLGPVHKPVLPGKNVWLKYFVGGKVQYYVYGELS